MIVTRVEKSKVKVSNKKVVLDNVLNASVIKVSLFSFIVLLCMSILYLFLYKNSIQNSYRINEYKTEITQLNFEIQTLNQEIQTNTNFKVIEEKASSLGMDYVDNLSYIK